MHDYAQVTWQVGANVDPARDIAAQLGAPRPARPRPAIQSLGGKIGIDATAKWASEGYPREWPEVARMSDEVRARVGERWDELGIPLGGARRRDGGAAAARRRGRLRRTR